MVSTPLPITAHGDLEKQKLNTVPVKYLQLCIPELWGWSETVTENIYTCSYPSDTLYPSATLYPC